MIIQSTRISASQYLLFNIYRSLVTHNGGVIVLYHSGILTNHYCLVIHDLVKSVVKQWQ